MKNRISLFDIGYCLYFISLFLPDVNIVGNDITLIIKLLRYTSYSFSICHIFSVGHYSVRNFLRIALFFSFVGLIVFFIRDVYYLAITLIIFSGLHKDKYKILKNSFTLLLTYSIAVAVLTTLGVKNNVMNRHVSGTNRWGLGYYHKNISIGSRVRFRNNLSLSCFKEGKIIFGNNGFLNNDCSINARQLVTIRDNCILGEKVKIYDYDYAPNYGNILIKDQDNLCKPVTIGSNCRISSDVIILAGTSIGDNSVIAAGCIVKGDIPANVVVKESYDLTMNPIISQEKGRLVNNYLPAVSIIMPVYNSEKYVGQAIQSVLKQSFKNFELIIIDDGSTDDSGKICDQYAENDSRITVVHKENGGVCSARNLGIRMCQGTFITFIDNDDLYEVNYLKVLVDSATATGADMVKAGRRNLKITSGLEILSEKVQTYKKAVVLSQDEFAKQYYDFKRSGILSSVWNGLYKRELINKSGIQFDENIKHGNEDIIFNCKFSLFSKTICIVPDVLYTHFYRSGHSTSTKFFPDQIRTRIEGINLELLIVGDNKNQADMIILEGIRECFRMLIPLKSAKERRLYISEIKSGLDFSILNKFKIFKNKKLSKAAKIDLIILRSRMYGLYFLLRKIRARFV